jgi:hypothetical protein
MPFWTAKASCFTSGLAHQADTVMMALMVDLRGWHRSQAFKPMVALKSNGGNDVVHVFGTCWM